MATYFSILAWRIPWTEEPGELHTVHGVAESDTTGQLTHFRFPLTFTFLWNTFHLFRVFHFPVTRPLSPTGLVQFSRSAIVSDPIDCSQASQSITNSPSLLKLLSIKLVMLFNCLILCYPLLLLPSIFPSIRVFSNESVLHIRWPKYWSFSFRISPSNEYSGLISFRIDWLDLLAVRGILKSLLQHHSLKASMLRHSSFLMVQLSHPYMTTGKKSNFNYTDLCR